MGEALGMIETKGLVAMIEAADAFVFQPEKVYPVFANAPVLPKTVTDAPARYVPASVGAVPVVLPLPL